MPKKPERYRFIINPYTDVRFHRCPRCEGKTLLRKFPLVIHVEPMNLMVLNKSCRYCPRCDLIIAHKDELEAQLVIGFEARNPEVIGNDYLVLGTVDRADWKEGRDRPVSPREMLDRVHIFKEVLKLEPGRVVPPPIDPSREA
jgi:hypothetical protein